MLCGIRTIWRRRSRHLLAAKLKPQTSTRHQPQPRAPGVDRFHDVILHLHQHATGGPQPRLLRHERVIARIDHEQIARGAHARPDLLQAIERAHWIARPLHEEHRRTEIEQHLVAQQAPDEPLVKQDLLALPLREAREQFERAYLLQQLMLCNGKVGLLAKRVGMERTHLYRKLRSLGVDFRQITED